MYPTKSFEADIPSDVLDLFMLTADRKLVWGSAPTHGRRTTKRAPWGAEAGGKPVVGRGKLITVSGYTLLTSDVRYALDHGGDWAWQTGASAPHVPDDHDPAYWMERIKHLFFHEGVLRWRVARGWWPDGSTRYAAGSPVTGLRLSGYRGSIVTTGGVGLLVSDVIHVLSRGCFPWNDWS